VEIAVATGRVNAVGAAQVGDRRGGGGPPPKAIQELAGHSTLAMTLRYMHLAPSQLREAIELRDFGQQMGNGAAVKS
jgi:hypothetical protein